MNTEVTLVEEMSDQASLRLLRRRGCARVSMAFETTLFGEFALTYSFRRVGWQARYRTWMFADREAAIHQVSRLLNSERQLIQRFALILQEGVVIRLVIPPTLGLDLSCLGNLFLRSLTSPGLSLVMLDDPQKGWAEAQVTRTNGAVQSDLSIANDPSMSNIVPFPKIPTPPHDIRTSLGVAFFDEKALSKLACQLYPYGITNLVDVCRLGLSGLKRLLLSDNNWRALVLLEGWAIEHGIDLAP